MRTRLFTLVALTLALLVVFAAPALAHDELVSSSPPNGATLTRLPSTVTLYFEEPPVAGFTHVIVTGPDGVLVSSGTPVTRGSQVSVPLPHSSATGSYSIAYRIMSDDGHPVAGTVRFSLGTGPATAGFTSRRPASRPVLLAGLLGGAAVVVLVLAMVSLRHGRVRSAGPDPRPLVRQ